MQDSKLEEGGDGDSGSPVASQPPTSLGQLPLTRQDDPDVSTYVQCQALVMVGIALSKVQCPLPMRTPSARSDTTKEYETVDDIDFMADLQRVEEDRLALLRENEHLQRQQVW